MDERAERDATELLERLWAEGPGIDDRALIERSSLACEGSPHVQLRAMLSWVDAMDGQPVGVVRDIERRELAAIGAATRMRHAINCADIHEIDRWLQIVAAEPVSSFAPVARGMIDLAIVDVGLFARNPAAVEATAAALAAEGQPVAIRIQALRRGFSIALASGDLLRATARAREVVELATAARRPLERQIGEGLAAICATLAGEKVDTAGDTLTDLSLAMLESPPRAIRRLTEMMQRAGAAGDALTYMLCALIGARRYVEIDRRVDAWLTVTSALVVLRERDPLYVEPLEEEREKWLAAWGQDEYDRVTRAGVELARKAHASG